MNGWNGLCNHISSLERVAVSFSGGFDSTVLLAAAVKALPDDHIAVFADVPMLSERQRRIAADVANEIGANIVTVRLGWDDVPDIRENTAERCYLCKKAIYSHVRGIASENGYSVCLDGENASDVSDERPGRRAASEFNILSPLKDLGIGREASRAMFNDLDLNVNVQKETCMATRFPSGTSFTDADLRMIEECEDVIRNISGVQQIRMRMSNGIANLFTSPDTIDLLTDNEDELRSILLKNGICDMNIDRKGYEG